MPSLGNIAAPKQGLATADNDRFLRLWWEPVYGGIAYGATSRAAALQSSQRWFPCDKGGLFRKWAGNLEYVINWENDGHELFGYDKAVVRNPNLYFQPFVAWSDVSSGCPAFRLRTSGIIFEHCANVIPISDGLALLALMNSSSVWYCLQVLAPTLHYGVGQAASVPVANLNERLNEILCLAGQAVTASTTDWDSFETSWDFKRHPLL